jgi:hypothetical protein
MHANRKIQVKIRADSPLMRRRACPHGESVGEVNRSALRVRRNGGKPRRFPAFVKRDPRIALRLRAAQPEE